MISRNKKFAIAAVFVVVGIIIGLVISSNLRIQEKGVAQDVPSVSEQSVDLLSKINEAMTEVVAKTKPTVVNISSTRTVTTPGGVQGHDFFDDPFFRRFFGFGMPRQFKEQALGSGVIVSKDGYILTNNHVISGGQDIKVVFSDNREFGVKVIGADAKTDLAVVKIEASNLPFLELGDSDELKAGETVIAIGSPYRLTATVTSGIVSATGRANVGIADYEDFIQTDAPINPGNSGGALVNIRGELVGINTAIFSTTGGYQGIGFAIPANMARIVMESLIKTGKVTRGWLGVSIQQITPELAQQFGLKNERGALVADVVAGSPAEKAGLKRGDAIVQYDGKDVSDPTQLRNMVAETAPGTEVKVEIIRERKPMTVTINIAELTEKQMEVASSFNNVFNGVHVQDLDAAIREQLDIPGRVAGVVITSVDPESPAHGILFQSDIIMEIDRKRIENTRDYESVVSGIKPGDRVLILVYRNGSTAYITISGE